MKTMAAAAATFLGAMAPVSAFLAPTFGGPIARPVAARNHVTPIMAIPLELEDKLDASRQWEIELELNGETKKLTIPEGTSVLEAAEQAFDDPPCSCRNGVCTTCAGLIQAGPSGEAYRVAIDALGDAQREKGYTLTCQTYPCGPGLKVLLNQYDKVYEMQYGQYEVGTEKAEAPKKMFGLF